MATIRKTTNQQWQVQIRRMGWPLQNKNFSTRKDAQAWARKTEHEMDQGQYVDQTRAQRTTFGDLIDIYIEQITNKRPSENSRISETSRLRRIQRVEPKLCRYAIANLEPEHFEDYRDRRLTQTASRGKNSPKTNKTVAPATVKRELNLMKRVIDHRRRWLRISYNPVNAEDVKRPSFNDERDVRLTPQEHDLLMQMCRESRNPYLAPLVELGFETGARRGNLMRLEWSDVDLRQHTALLRGVKNSRNPEIVLNQSIGLTPRAVEVIESLPRTDLCLFPVTANAIRKAFEYARAKAGLQHFRFHDTRHERVSSLFEAGWDSIKVMAQSGHRDPKSLKRYANISANHLANELAKL